MTAGDECGVDARDGKCTSRKWVKLAVSVELKAGSKYIVEPHFLQPSSPVQSHT